MVNIIPLGIIGGTLLGCVLVILCYLFILCCNCSTCSRCCAKDGAKFSSIEKSRTTSYQIEEDGMTEEEKAVIEKLTKIQEE